MILYLIFIFTKRRDPESRAAPGHDLAKYGEPALMVTEAGQVGKQNNLLLETLLFSPSEAAASERHIPDRGLGRILQKLAAVTAG